MSLFGRKTVGGGKLFTIFFCAVSFFAVFYRHKPLHFSDKRRSEPSPKNHTKNPTVGFWCFGCYARIFSVRMKKDMQAIEGEAVARQGNGNREWTQIDANWDSSCLALAKCCEAGMISRFVERKKDDKDVFAGTPNKADDPSPLRFDATRTSSLPQELDSEDGQRWASIGGSAFKGCCKSLIFNLILRKSLISKTGFMQVVDFHDRFGKFRVVADISNAFLEMRKTRLAGVFSSTMEG